MQSSPYQQLTVWQKAMDLLEIIYQITKLLPKEEKYGIASQMQRAAVAIPSNIAEGRQRQHQREYAHFLTIALASAAKLETQVLICHRIGHIEPLECTKTLSRIDEVKKMLYSLIHSLHIERMI